MVGRAVISGRCLAAGGGGRMRFDVSSNDESSFRCQSSSQRVRVNLLTQLVLFVELALRQALSCFLLALGVHLNLIFFDHLQSTASTSTSASVINRHACMVTHSGHPLTVLITKLTSV